MNTFPAFPRKPSRDLFPMYGFVPAGKGFQIECDVRKRTPSGNRSEMVQPLPGIYSRKQVEKLTGDLNLAVWTCMQQD